MTGWDLLEGVAAAAVVWLVSLVLAVRHARARRADLPLGKPHTFDASLRANAAPYPRRWRNGSVTVNAGPPFWRPRFSLTRRPIVLPMSASVEMIRKPVNLWEGLIVNTECRVIVARAGDVKLELAALPSDIPTALMALESGSAVSTLYSQ